MSAAHGRASHATTVCTPHPQEPGPPAQTPTRTAPGEPYLYFSAPRACPVGAHMPLFCVWPCARPLQRKPLQVGFWFFFQICSATLELARTSATSQRCDSENKGAASTSGPRAAMFPNLSALFLVLLFVAPSIVRPFHLSPSNAPMSLPALLPSPAHPDGPCPHENDAHTRSSPSGLAIF